MTVHTVADGQKSRPTLEDLETYMRRELELRKRFMAGQLNAGGCLGTMQQMLEGTVLCPKWTFDERDRIYYIDVESTGRIGEHWQNHFNITDVGIDEYVAAMLHKSDFVYTTDKRYRLAIMNYGGFRLAGWPYYSLEAAKAKGFDVVSEEAACLLRSKLASEELVLLGCRRLVCIMSWEYGSRSLMIKTDEAGCETLQHACFEPNFFDPAYAYVFLVPDPVLPAETANPTLATS